MNKFLSFNLSLILIVMLTACGGSGQSGGKSDGVAGDESGLSQRDTIGGEITVAAYDAITYKGFLEEAAKLFEEKYPGTKVHVEIHSAMPEIKTSEEEGGDMLVVGNQNNPQSKLDYINKINAALMSGGGADVLAMDVLPFYKYADSGQLENLMPYIESDSEFNLSHYRTNVFDAVGYKGGTWFLPIDYSFNFYTYDSGLLPGNAASRFGIEKRVGAKELMELAAPSFDGGVRIFDRPAYAEKPRPDMWSLLLDESYTAFVDVENKSANFSSAGFEDLLDSVKEYSDAGYISKGTTEKSGTEEMMKRAKEDAEERFFFKHKSALSLMSFFTRNLNIGMSAMGEGNTMTMGDNDEIAGIESNADGSVPFNYSQAYGINANSENKITSWAFLEFLLSEEMQLSTNLRSTALPVLNRAREKKMELLLTSIPVQLEQSQRDALMEANFKYNEAVEKLSEQIDTYVIRDTAIDEMIAAEVGHFFEGSKTATQVAEVLQNKVDLYLNE